MEITDVSVTKLRAELDEPSVISKYRSIEARPAAIVEVEIDEGIVGIGEGYGPNPHIVETIVERKFADDLIGENPLDVERLWDEMVMGYTYWGGWDREMGVGAYLSREGTPESVRQDDPCDHLFRHGLCEVCGVFLLDIGEGFVDSPPAD